MMSAIGYYDAFYITFILCFQEGRTIVESKTADIIQETRKLQIRRKGANFEELNHESGVLSAAQHSAQQHVQTSQEDQLKISRDVSQQLCNGVFLVHVKKDK